MPEGVEVQIMSEFINEKSKDKIYKKMSYVEKGNMEIISNEIENFKVSSESIGKELVLKLTNKENEMKFSVFMGMSGNWKLVPTKEWNNTKFVRMKLDLQDGWSLILHGGYMGPKFKLNGFNGIKRGPDIVKDFDKFKENVLSNLDRKEFQNPICDVLLNQKYFNGIGAYLNSEIVGRLDINPFRKFNSLSTKELEDIFNMILKCHTESYNLGGGELRDWKNPFKKSRTHEWIKFYGNKNTCFKQKFGKRNIWINKKWKLPK